MANVKFSDLPTVLAVQAADIFCITQSAVSRQATISQLLSDAAVSGSWDGSLIGATRNSLRDYFILFDTDLDGKVNVLDVGAGIVKTDSGGIVAIAVAGTDYENPLTFASPLSRSVNAISLLDSVDYGFTASQSIVILDAGTGVTDVFKLGHNTSGAVGANFGTGMTFRAETDTTLNTDMSRINSAWSVATHASRQAYFDFLLANGAGSVATTARLHGGGGLSVGATVNPGLGVINANVGFQVANAAASNKVLKGDGTKFGPSTETYDAPGTSGNQMVSDGVNWKSITAASVFANGSTAASGPGAYASNTILAGSTITVPTAGMWKVGGQYHCVFDMTKTGAGTAAIAINFHIGTAGTTSDTIAGTVTFPVGTANADTGIFDVYLNFRNAGASAIVSMYASLKKNNTTIGLVNSTQNWSATSGTSASFNSLAATKISLGFNGGTSFSGSTVFVQATYIQ